MLSFVGWIILLVILTAAAPAVGLLLGLSCAGLVIKSSDALSGLWDNRPRLSRGFDLPSMNPGVTLNVPCANLPGRLLRERQHLFRLDCVEANTGQKRVYTILAKHAGAATMKARAWGERLRSIESLETTDR